MIVDVGLRMACREISKPPGKSDDMRIAKSEGRWNSRGTVADYFLITK